ncbi:MAG: hypothetical protein IPI50_06345 [Saprospiraceae bacterium]|nr:hypothetical protein [Saprospiraceae bacterium]
MPTFNKVNSWFFSEMKILILLFIYFAFYVVENKNYTIAFDSFGYYAYLPAIFHLKDVRLNNIEPLAERNKKESNSELPLYQIHQVKNSSNHVIRYPIGMAVSYSPSFLFSYAVCELFGIDHDQGFNLIYKKILFYWSFLISILGIFILYRFLNFYFNKNISVFVVGLIVFGTNYWLHSCMYGQGIMSQNYLFTYYALLLYFTHRFYASYRYLFFSIIIALVSLIAICRNSEIFCVLIPLLYGITSIKDFFPRLRILLSNKLNLIISLLPGLLIIGIQLVYWKIVTGHFFYYSYQDNPGEKLDIFNPYLMEVTLSFRKGLFIYTPMSILMILGLWFVYKYYKNWSLAIISFSVINFYIIASWSCWWYSESFGQRAIVPMYSVWALGFAALTNYFLKLINYKRILYIFCLLLILILNLFQTWQVDQGILPVNHVSRDYYFSVFGQIKSPSDEQKSLLLTQDLIGLKTEIDSPFLRSLDREFIYSTLPDGGNMVDSEYSISRLDSQILNTNNPFSKSITIPNKYLNNADFKMIKLTAWVSSPEHTGPFKFGIVAHRIANGKFYGWHISPTPVDLFKEKQFHKLTYWYMVSEVQRNEDVFKTYVWNLDERELIVYGMEAEVYTPKTRKKIFLW